MLDGSASLDPEGAALIFVWKQVSGDRIALVGADTARVTFTAPDVAVSQTLVFGLTVSDGTQVASDEVSVTVSPRPDVLPPRVISKTPADGATNVARNAKIIVQFNEAMNEASLSGSMVVRAAGTMLSGVLSYDAINFKATFMPNAPLAASTIHTVDLLSSITDRAGNALTGISWSFTTITDTAPQPARGQGSTRELGQHGELGWISEQRCGDAFRSTEIQLASSRGPTGKPDERPERHPELHRTEQGRDIALRADGD